MDLHLEASPPFTRLQGIVFAALLPDTIDIDIGAFYPMSSGNGLRVVHRSWVASIARMPNAPVWVYFDQNMGIVAVTRRELAS